MTEPEAGWPHICYTCKSLLRKTFFGNFFRSQQASKERFTGEIRKPLTLSLLREFLLYVNIFCDKKSLVPLFR
jgi:hypothetical protein